jgi:hypothetical protein
VVADRAARREKGSGKLRVDACGGKIEREDLKRRKDRLDDRRAPLPAFQRIGTVDANQEFGRGDAGNRRRFVRNERDEVGRRQAPALPRT